MTPVAAELVDIDKLAQVVAAASGFGLAFAVAFALAILAGTRSWELRRGGSAISSVALGAAAGVALLVCLGAVVLGVVVVASK